jgi:hypothetical protein
MFDDLNANNTVVGEVSFFIDNMCIKAFCSVELLEESPNR